MGLDKRTVVASFVFLSVILICAILIQTSGTNCDFWSQSAPNVFQPELAETFSTNQSTGSSTSSCTFFVVLTTQRSGSTWFGEALGKQPEVFFGHERLMHFSFKKESVPAAEWESATDKVLETICELAKQEGKQIAGFKLMYDQVKGPLQSVNNSKIRKPLLLPNGTWFQNYLFARKVHIIHLVREAVILHVASDIQTAMDIKKLNLTGNQTHHATDPQIAAARMKAEKIHITKRHLDKLNILEAQHFAWLHYVQRSGLPYLYVSYEDLLSYRRDTLFHMALQFLGVKDLKNYPPLQSTFQQLHPSPCEDRIADFVEVQRMINGTMSDRACRMLSGLNASS
eukprot:Skav213602  [mRNA]  locus=scaffold1971:57979:59001:+ [translate_table: standard]